LKIFIDPVRMHPAVYRVGHNGLYSMEKVTGKRCEGVQGLPRLLMRWESDALWG